MKSRLLALALLAAPLAGFAADIASVNFKAIQNDLREYYFTKPENAELKERFQTLTQDEARRLEEMQANIAAGKPALDFKAALAKGPGPARFQFERKLDADLKKELYLILAGLGLKYELVYDASDAETVLYAKAQIDDVTPLVKQAVIDLTKRR